jgi:polyhydroxyalkanoate synthesis regulator phasin
MVTGTKEQNDQAIEVLSEIMQELQKNYPAYYKKYDNKLESIYKHGALTEQEAREAVSHLVNEDGTRGAHWDVDSIRKVVEMYPELSVYNFWCVYYVMNMIYSDYYDSSYSIKTYVKLAKDFIGDKDAPSDKVKRYIEAMK